MTLTKEQKETLAQGFLQVGLSVLLYLTYSLLGFITVILTGFILNGIILPYVQGIIILLTQSLAGYFSVKTLQTDIERLE